MNDGGMKPLVRVDQAMRMLSKVTQISDVTDLRARFEALRQYAKSVGLGLDAQNRAAEVKLRAERKEEQRVIPQLLDDALVEVRRIEQYLPDLVR